MFPPRSQMGNLLAHVRWRDLEREEEMKDEMLHQW